MPPDLHQEALTISLAIIDTEALSLDMKGLMYGEKRQRTQVQLLCDRTKAPVRDAASSPFTAGT